MCLIERVKMRNEVISAVMGHDVEFIKYTMNDMLYQNVPGCRSSINVYELAHMCKEWALRKCYELHSHIAYENDEYSFCEARGLDVNDREVFIDDDEPEAIFKATEWVYDSVNRKPNVL
jgi:hypothetical protein